MFSRVSRRLLVALAAVLASLGAVVAVPLAVTQASATGLDTWGVAAGYAGTATVTDNGSTDGNPSFSYFYCSQPGGTPSSCTDGGAGAHTWTFEATAQSAESVTGSYSWNGFHAFYDVTADLSAFVTTPGGTTTTSLVSAGPVNCCTAPSGGFDYSGSYTFSGLASGDVYGFDVSGSNFDSNSQLRGTFSFDTAPPLYAPAAPTNLVANAGFETVGLSWTAPGVSAGAGAPTGYQVLVGTSSGGEAVDASAAITGTTAILTQLPASGTFVPGTTYYFTVEALNGAGAGPPSGEVSVVAGGTNTSWFTASTVALGVGSGGASGSSTPQSIDQAGEALWYDFAITPDEQVQVCVSNPPADYGLALFSDIGQAYANESTTPNLAELGAQIPGSAASPSAFSPSVFSPSAFSPSAFSPSAFSPSAFSPSAFSPSAFSPSAFSPSAFSPSAFSPSAFSPSAFSPSAFSPSAFSADYSAAQIDSLLAVSTVPGAVSKCVSADSWNNTGNFYVRVTGNNGAFAPLQDFTISVTTSGAVCPSSLSSYSGDSTITGSGAPETVILEDSALMPAVGSGYTGTDALYQPLQQLASATNGVIVDVSQSTRVDDLVAQAKANPACPYAENLVASAIQAIVNSYRSSSLEYVVIVGDDDVIPSFRYPDDAGLAPESDYQPPLLSTSPAGAALASDQYLSDDQYGAASELEYQGTTVPLSSAAVGRLVESPADILATITSYLNGASTITPTSSLVTGYDFMAPPAQQVETAFTSGMPSGTNDTLISTPSTPSASLWTAQDLESKLFGSHHDLVFLGGHFSANNLLAADDTTTLTTNQFASQVGTSLQGSLVLAAGCHAGYSIDPTDAVPGVTDPLAWPQAFAEAGATLIAGTGYQYGDTNYVAYSDQIYVDLAQQLGYTPASGSTVAVGTALLRAKLDYLAGLDQLTGLEEKALLEITLYGLPMLGVAEPNQGPAPSGSGSAVTPSPLGTGPGAPVSNGGLGLSEAPLVVTTSTSSASSPSLLLTPQSVTPPGSTTTYTYDSGPQGVTAEPASPVLPVQLVDVSGGSSGTLRGVGFWSGSYTDTAGTNPLTGDPATDSGNPAVLPFASPVLFPQTQWNPNFFPTLIDGGDTELAVTPVQYVSDPSGASTDTMRTFSDMKLDLFYSGNTQSYTASDGSTNTPALAAPPTISGVTSTVAGDTVTVSATVTGDPNAGIQEVWVSYTGAAAGDPLYGSWQSVDLTQSSSDSTQWSGSFTDSNASATGTPASDARFIVQAVNGVGEVSMDNNDGYFFTPSLTPGAPLTASANTYTLTLGGATSGTYEQDAPVTATLAPVAGDPSSIVAGQTISFGIAGTTVTATTGADGSAQASIPLIMTPGSYTLSASYAGDASDAPVATSESFQTSKQATSLQLNVPQSQLVAGTDNAITATLTATGGSGSVPVAQKAVYFVISGAGGTVLTTTGITNASGVASAGVLDVPAADTGSNGTGDSVTAYFGSSAVPLPGSSPSSLDATDQYLAGSTSSPSTVSVVAPPTITITAPSSVIASGTATPLSYSTSVVNYDGTTEAPSCNLASGSGFPLGTTTITCTATDGYGNTGTATTKVTVEPAPLTVSISGVQTYGGSPTWTFTASGYVGGDTAAVISGKLACTTSPATTSASTPGSYPIATCSGLSIPAYYLPSFQYGKLVVGAAPLTITASSATTTYGQAPPAISPSYSGFVDGDTPSSLSQQPTCTTSASAASQPGSYTTSCTGAADPNYSPISKVNGVLVVTPSTMLLLGSGAGALTMSGQSSLQVRGSLDANTSNDPAVTMTGQAALQVSGALISPSSTPVVSKGDPTLLLGSTQNLAAENDPYAGLALPSTSGLTVFDSSTIEGPGVYTRAVTIAGRSQVDLASGIYIFDDGLSVSGQAKLTSQSSGVLLYFAGGSLSISGQAAVALTPLTSGTYEGVGLFESPTDSQAVLLSGQSQATSLAGALYAPSAVVQLSGQGSVSLGRLVASGVVLTGEGTATVG